MLVHGLLPILTNEDDKHRYEPVEKSIEVGPWREDLLGVERVKWLLDYFIAAVCFDCVPKQLHSTQSENQHVENKQNQEVSQIC